VTSEKAWTLDPERLQEALARWHGLNPDARSVRHVEEFLMDLVDDPFECGQEDDDTGNFTGRAGSDFRPIVVVYVPDRKLQRVFVADINFA
jgi:hypothetical protein